MSKIIYSCPDCGGDEWHTMQNLNPGEYCCCNCGTVCTQEEMSAKEVRLSPKGKALRDDWEQKYFAENDRLGGDSKNGDFVEGWSIIDNAEHVKTITDICGLMLFGYDGDDALSLTYEWVEMYGAHYKIWLNFTCAEIKKELLKYFE